MTYRGTLKMKKRSLCVYLCVTIFLALTFSLADAATISGTINLENGGHPQSSEVSLTYVTTEGLDDACEAWGGYSQTPPGYTSDTGAYTVNGVVPGSYYMYHFKSGTNLVKEWITSSGSSENCHDAIPILIAAQEDSLDGYDFELAPGGTVRGVVKDEDGNPLSNVTVGIYSGDSNACSYFSKREGYAYSMSNTGVFEITGLPLNKSFSATTQIHGEKNFINEWYATSSESTRDCNTATLFTIPDPTPIEEINFFLDPGSLIRGTVTSGTAPLTNIPISLISLGEPVNFSAPCYSGMSTLLNAAYTNSAGEYEILGLESGSYMISVDADSSGYITEYWADPKSVRECNDGQVVTISAGGEVHADKDLQIEHGSIIRGRVINGVQEAVTNYTVSVTQESNDPLPSVQFTATDLSGYYMFSGLETGNYIVSAQDSTNTLYMPQWWNGANSSAEATPVVISTDEQDESGINFELQPSSTIRGTIRKQDGTIPPWTELSHLLLSAQEGDTCLAFNNFSGQINTDGTYIVSGLPPGKYRVNIYGDGTVNYIPAWSVGGNSTDQCDQLSGSVDITTQGQEVSGVDFQMIPGATIQGTISRDDTAAVLAGDAMVNITQYSSDACNSFPSKWVHTAAGGSYVLTGLPAGEYFVQVTKGITPNSPDFVAEWLTGENTNSTRDCNQAERITVGASNPQEIFNNRNFQVDLGGILKGFFFEHDGITANVGFQEIHFHTDCTVENWVASSSNFLAQYTSPILAPGHYYLSLLEADRKTFIGWLSESGQLVNNCASARTVEVLKGETSTGINFILKPDFTLVPIYMLLLNK